jgi:hypothetical protein
MATGRGARGKEKARRGTGEDGIGWSVSSMQGGGADELEVGMGIFTRRKDRGLIFRILRDSCVK